MGKKYSFELKLHISHPAQQNTGTKTAQSRQNTTKNYPSTCCLPLGLTAFDRERHPKQQNPFCLGFSSFQYTK
jgi:hypothetical protein